MIELATTLFFTGLAIAAVTVVARSTIGGIAAARDILGELAQVTAPAAAPRLRAAQPVTRTARPRPASPARIPARRHAAA